MDAEVDLLPIRTDQVPEHVINQVKSKSSLDCFQLFCIWHSPAVTLDLVKQVRQGIEQQRQTTPSSDQQHGCASCKKQGCQTASSSSTRKKQREPKRGKTRSGTSTDPALQPDGIMVTNHLATLWRTLPTREKNVYRKLVPVLLRKQADSPPPTGQRDQLSKGGPEAQTTISLGKRRNSASKCQGKGDGLSPTLGGCGSITATSQGNASGPNSDVQVKGHTALAVAAAVHEARGNSLADILHSCSAANGHHHPVDETLVDQLSSIEVVDDRKPKKVVTLPSSNSIEIPRSGSPVLLPSSVLSSSPQGIPGLISTKEMAISGLHTVDLDLHLSGSLSRKAKKKANKKNRQAALKKLEAGPKLEAKVAKATKHVRFARKAEVFTFERAQGGSAVPLQGAHPLTLGKYVATLLLPICSDEATATKENGSNEAKAPKPKKRHPCHGPKEEELTAMEEKQRIRILRNALGEQWEDQEEVRFAALDAKECQTIRNSRSRNCCDCGTGKNRASRCDTAKCACHRAGVGCHAEGGSYCQCNMRCCQNPDGRYQFKGAVVNKARKRQISDYWSFVASAEYNWSPKGQELLAYLGLIDWPEDEMDQEEVAATTAETPEVDNSTLGCEEELEA